MSVPVETSGQRMAQQTATTPSAPDFEPIRIVEIELTQPLPGITAVDDRTGHSYRRAMALVRLHTYPLGWIPLQFDAAGLAPADCARQVWDAMGPAIAAHLRMDGLPPIARLDGAGIPGAGTPPCIRDRERFLATAPFVSVIVPTHERADRLAGCLRSLLAQEYPRYEIIVVDNAPTTPATYALVQELAGAARPVRYVREDRPGSASARNRGLAAATGEIVAFTDDDAVVDAHWLAELCRAFGVAGNVACVTGLILPLELETPAQVWFEQYGGFSHGFARRVYDLNGNRPDDPLYPYTAGQFGAAINVAFKKSLLHAIGDFDPALGNGTPALSGVDFEAFFRVIVSGYTLVYEPAAIAFHLHRRDYARLRKQIYNYGVGLTAVLTKSVLAHPRMLLDLAGKLPYALRFTFDSRSAYHAHKGADYPRELTRLERAGMLYGPLAYLRSRRQVRAWRSGHEASASAPRTMGALLQNRFMSALAPQHLYRIVGAPGQRAGAWLYLLAQRAQRDFSMRLVEGLVQRGDAVIDIGASWGFFTWRLARLVGPGGHVYACEPHPANAGSLAALRGGRAHVTIYPLALSDHDGTAELYAPRWGSHHVTALASLVAPRHDPSGVTYETVPIGVARLDALLPGDGPPITFIKCDVEGHELATLRGAEALLRRWRPTLLIEIEQRHQEADIQTTFDYLTGLGYVGYALDADHLKPLNEFDVQRDQLAFLGSGFTPSYVMPRSYVCNFLFVRQDVDVRRWLKRTSGEARS